MAEPEPVKPIEVITVPAPFTIYHPPLPQEIVLEDVQWHVITFENLEEKIKELEKLQSIGFVVFAITPQSYENLSYNMQELRRYIRQQNNIIVYYRNIDTVPKDSLQPTTK